MTNMEDFIAAATECGMDHAAELNCQALKFMPEVRDMCAENKCHMYGKCWSCPPACGTIEECAARCEKYARGVIVQSTGQLEDSFDMEGIEELSKRHAANFRAFADKVLGEYPGALPLGAGGCNRCKVCAYPDAPCRFPELMLSSMEGYGLLVSDVCKASGIKYYYGPDTLTYTACVLID